MGLNWSGAEFHLHMQTNFAPHLWADEFGNAEFVGALNLLDSGTTSVLEWCHGAVTPEHTDAAIAALRESGVRAVFGHGTVKTLPAPGEAHYSTVPHPRAEAMRVREQLPESEMLCMALAVLGPDYAGLEVNRADFTLAADLDVMTTAHVHQINSTPEAYLRLAREGLLRTPHNAVHATGLPDEQLRTILEHGGSVTATSMTEIGSGPREPVIGRLLALGGRPSIGSDSEANTATDMFAAMRESLAIQRLFDHLYRADASRGEHARDRLPVLTDGDPEGGERTHTRLRPTSADALRWATLDNAKALGIDHLVGSLTPGKRAYIVLVRSDDPDTAPGLNPTDTVVSLAHPGNVDTVLVDGCVMKQRGQLLSHVDRRITTAVGHLRETGNRLLTDLRLQELRGVSND